MDCIKCKHELAPNQKFCDNCGMQVSRLKTSSEIVAMADNLREAVNKMDGASAPFLALCLQTFITLDWVLGQTDLDPLGVLVKTQERDKRG
jgi:hypothetical protein